MINKFFLEYLVHYYNKKKHKELTEIKKFIVVSF